MIVVKSVMPQNARGLGDLSTIQQFPSISISSIKWCILRFHC